jgi:hypothetical protein
MVIAFLALCSGRGVNLIRRLLIKIVTNGIAHILTRADQPDFSPDLTDQAEQVAQAIGFMTWPET